MSGNNTPGSLSLAKRVNAAKRSSDYPLFMAPIFAI
jgi:hypothetical protein